MSRIPYPEPASLSPAKRAWLDAPELRVLNIARMSMHAPDPIWAATVQMAIAVVTDTLISTRLREVLILVVGTLSNSEYELHHHRSMGRAVGLTEAEIAAIEAGDYAALGPDERLVARFTHEVVAQVSPSDDTLAATRARFSDPEVFEMVGIIASYMNAARVAAVGGIANDEIPVRSWAEERATAR